MEPADFIAQLPRVLHDLTWHRAASWRGCAKETLNKSFDKALLSEVEGLRTNGK